MNFLNYHFPTWLSKGVLLLAAVLLALFLFGHGNQGDDQSHGYGGESLGQVAEHAAVYDGVRKGMNAMFRSHRDNYYRDEHHYEE